MLSTLEAVKLLQSSSASLPVWALQLLKRLSQGKKHPLDNFRLQPDLLFRMAGLMPDPWQQRILSSAWARLILLCSRQVGKSTVVAAVALLTALLEAPALVLILSPSERQSGEFMVKVRTFYNAIKRPRKAVSRIAPLTATQQQEADLDAAWKAIPDKERESALQLHLKNGSRIIGLPNNPTSIVGYSGASLLVLDEAARVPDGLYKEVRPMLAVNNGRLIALSTPLGKRGWFYEEWIGETLDGRKVTTQWDRYMVPATQCTRLKPAFLQEEMESLGKRWFAQQYLCDFSNVTGSYFDPDDVAAAAYQGEQLTLGGHRL